MTAAAASLRRTAAASLKVNEAGITGDDLHEELDIAQRLADVVHGGYPQNIDADRYSADVTTKLDLPHLRVADLRTWLARLPEYALQRDKSADAVAELSRRLQQTAHEVAATKPEGADLSRFNRDLQRLEVDVATFGQSRFTSRDLADGTFANRQKALSGRIDALRAYTAAPQVAPRPGPAKPAPGWRPGPPRKRARRLRRSRFFRRCPIPRRRRRSRSSSSRTHTRRGRPRLCRRSPWRPPRLSPRLRRVRPPPSGSRHCRSSRRRLTPSTGTGPTGSGRLQVGRADMDDRPEALADAKRQTAILRATLEGIDKQFPRAPTGLNTPFAGARPGPPRA